MPRVLADDPLEARHRVEAHHGPMNEKEMIRGLERLQELFFDVRGSVEPETKARALAGPIFTEAYHLAKIAGTELLLSGETRVTV